MKKKLIGIIIVLLLMITTALSVLAYQGYVFYRRQVAVTPIEEAVSAYTSKEDYVPFKDIDTDFVHAVVSVEDKRFFSRKGYDIQALIRALYHNLLAKDFVEGGSTISEQIAKNLYMGGYVDGLEEKSAEIFLMYELEKQYSKEELFALYANMNYYGDGYWGIRQACEGYYDTEPSDLSLARAAILAGIPNAPAVYQLSDGFDQAKERQEWVLYTMFQNAYISEEEMNTAISEDVRPVDHN